MIIPESVLVKRLHNDLCCKIHTQNMVHASHALRTRLPTQLCINLNTNFESSTKKDLYATSASTPVSWHRIHDIHFLNYWFLCSKCLRRWQMRANRVIDEVFRPTMPSCVIFETAYRTIRIFLDEVLCTWINCLCSFSKGHLCLNKVRFQWRQNVFYHYFRASCIFQNCALLYWSIF